MSTQSQKNVSVIFVWNEKKIYVHFLVLFDFLWQFRRFFKKKTYLLFLKSNKKFSYKTQQWRNNEKQNEEKTKVTKNRFHPVFHNFFKFIFYSLLYVFFYFFVESSRQLWHIIYFTWFSHQCCTGLFSCRRKSLMFVLWG